MSYLCDSSEETWMAEQFSYQRRMYARIEFLTCANVGLPMFLYVNIHVVADPFIRQSLLLVWPTAVIHLYNRSPRGPKDPITRTAVFPAFTITRHISHGPWHVVSCDALTPNLFLQIHTSTQQIGALNHCRKPKLHQSICTGHPWIWSHITNPTRGGGDCLAPLVHVRKII